MGNKKGTRVSKPGRRKRGVPNKITRELRAVINEFLNNNIDSAQLLFNRVAKGNPYRALMLWGVNS